MARDVTRLHAAVIIARPKNWTASYGRRASERVCASIIYARVSQTLNPPSQPPPRVEMRRRWPFAESDLAGTLGRGATRRGALIKVSNEVLLISIPAQGQT